jgi:large subunit ribosomal protein L10
MTREEKNQTIEALSQKLNEASHFYITSTSGLNSAVTSELRRLCYARKINLLVVKNTLLRKAMEKSDKDLHGLFDTLKGTTSVMFTEVSNSPAKLIREFRTKYKTDKPELKGAYAEESTYLGNHMLDALESIKSKNEVIADIIALLQSPTKNVIGALQSGGHKLSGILKTLSEKEA